MSRAVCNVDECDNGWRSVGEKYVADHSMLPKEWTDEAEREVARRAAALGNSVYPCRNCRTDQFYIWLGDHYAPDHSPDCADCAERRRRRRPGTKITDPVAHARADLAHEAETKRRDLA